MERVLFSAISSDGEGLPFIWKHAAKGQKTAIQCQGKKGLFNYLFSCLGFFFFLPFFLCTPPAGGWGHLRTSLIRKSKITPSFSLL